LSVLNTLFAIVIPYTAIAIFIIGFIYRIIVWACSPVPFHIPTVCGQQKSLLWIKSNKTESPSTIWGIFVRMVLEVLLFRSLFRNDRAEITGQERLIYWGNKLLWVGGIIFHWSLFIILFRHLKLFFEPVPGCVAFLQNLDGLFQVFTPTLLITDALIVIALCYLVLRRIIDPQVRYISLISDYFPIFLILGIAVSGILMKYFYRVDLLEVKRFTLLTLSFNPIAPRGLGIIFYIHLFLVSILLAYFPFSKLMHMGGVFMSPTRNLKNDSRAKRHINPWSYPVKVHTYEEWEEEFKDAIKEAGLPLEKE
jgi:nitrate reductase gamma subunit